MSNQSFKNSYIKIGKSSKDPEVRKKNLYTTGVPKEFNLEYYALVENYHRVERAVHNKFKENRIEYNREFFDIKIDYVVNFIRTFCADTLLWETPFKSSTEVLKELKERKKLEKQETERKLNNEKFDKKLNELRIKYDKIIDYEISRDNFYFFKFNFNLFLKKRFKISESKKIKYLTVLLSLISSLYLFSAKFGELLFMFSISTNAYFINAFIPMLLLYTMDLIYYFYLKSSEKKTI